MTYNEMKKILLGEEYQAGNSDVKSDNNWIRLGGFREDKLSATNDFLRDLSKGKQRLNYKCKIISPIYPMTENTPEQFADACTKIKDLQKVFKQAAKNPAASERQKMVLKSATEDFNAIFTRLIAISKKIDNLDEETN